MGRNWTKMDEMKKSQKENLFVLRVEKGRLQYEPVGNPVEGDF